MNKVRHRNEQAHLPRVSFSVQSPNKKVRIYPNGGGGQIVVCVSIRSLEFLQELQMLLHDVRAQT